jgi:hypothetical protein
VRLDGLADPLRGGLGELYYLSPRVAMQLDCYGGGAARTAASLIVTVRAEATFPKCLCLNPSAGVGALPQEESAANSHPPPVR